MQSECSLRLQMKFKFRWQLLEESNYKQRCLRCQLLCSALYSAVTTEIVEIDLLMRLKGKIDQSYLQMQVLIGVSRVSDETYDDGTLMTSPLRSYNKYRRLRGIGMLKELDSSMWRKGIQFQVEIATDVEQNF